MKTFVMTAAIFYKRVGVVFALFASLGLVSFHAGAQGSFVKYVPKAAAAKPLKARPFTAGEVRLLDGPFKLSQEAETANLLSLDDDRLLYPFLLEAGLTPKAPTYLGWEQRLLPGVGLSFYLSGISRIYKQTENQELLRRLNYILDELEKCQQKTGGYLLGTKGGKAIFVRVEKEGAFPGFGYWGRGEATPYYSLEKLLSGLRDVYRITHSQKALQIALGIGNWLQGHMSRISDETLQALMKIEYGGMNWVLADLYADTGEKKFLAMSRRWQDNITVAPFVQGRDVLNGVHGNMQFPKFSGLAARYPYSGEAGDLAAARLFWESVVYHRTYVTGGNSESEYFGPPDSLSKRLTPFTEENCNEYNMLRLTALLAQIDPKVEYADYTERTLFNHLLPAQNPATGQLTYHLPLMPGAERTYQPLEYFSCCTASGLDSYSRPAEYIYSRTASAILVNLFIASEVADRERGLSIKQETAFPDKDLSTLTITCPKPVTTDIAIRNPYWISSPVIVSINGKQQSVSPAADGYLHLQRKWNNKDVVTIKLPMQLRTESMPDDKSVIALFYGPVLLAAEPEAKDADALVEANEAPVLVSTDVPLQDWLKPAGGSLEFVTAVAQPKQVSVKPFFRKHTGPYAVYWQKLSGEEWKQRLADKQRKANDEAKMEAATVDKVIACAEGEGGLHGMFGPGQMGTGNAGILKGYCWRASSSDPWGYDLAVSGEANNTLVCKYMGRKDYDKWNCRLTVDGVVLKTFQREKDDSQPVGLWQGVYPIPLELTKGKAKVRVMFEKIDDKPIEMPRVIEMRTVKQARP